MDFVEQVKNIKLEEGVCSTSYDVKVLFTSVLVEYTINIIKNKLEQDAELPNRIFMSIPNIIALLEFCLNNSLFLVPGQVLYASADSSHGVTHKPNFCQSVHGGLWSQGH